MQKARGELEAGAEAATREIEQLRGEAAATKAAHESAEVARLDATLRADQAEQLLAVSEEAAAQLRKQLHDSHLGSWEATGRDRMEHEHMSLQYA